MGNTQLKLNNYSTFDQDRDSIGNTDMRINNFISTDPRKAFFFLIKKQIIELAKNLKHFIGIKTFILALIVLAVVLLFGNNIKDILFVGVLAVFASYSTIYKRTIRVPSAIELVTLGTVITGAAYGPLIGALFGVSTTLASEIISSGVDVFTAFYTLARGIAGIASYFLVANGMGVVMTGMMALVIWHIISDFVYIVSGDVEAKIKVLYYAVVNTSFNLLVFFLLGGFLLNFAKL
jgi:hypothetical protein